MPSSDEDALEDTLPASSDGGATPTPAPAPTPSALPDRIGRYEIKDTLGAGGMGTVLLAVDPVLGRKVALKVLHPDGRNDNETTRRRLLREAQGIAQLVHEHVVVVHEIGTHDDRVFLAMEHVAGQTLGKWQVGRLLAAELVVVLLVTFGLSGLYSVLDLVSALLAPEALDEQTAALNASRSTHAWLDLAYQLLGVLRLVAWAALPLVLLAHTGIGPRAVGLVRERAA